MKTVLAIWNHADKGKTETLGEFANLLILTYPKFRPILPIPANVSISSDFRLILEINGKVIGIESDPKSNLENRLIDLADNFHCELILCSSLVGGETVKAVSYPSDARDFQKIWTSTYQISDSIHHNFVNSLKAKHLLELLQGLSLL